VGAFLRSRPPGSTPVQVVTKAAGPAPGMPWLRDGAGAGRLLGADVRRAAEGSLSRLGVERIDALLLHWPDRGPAVPLWGERLYDPRLRFGPAPGDPREAAVARRHPRVDPASPGALALADALEALGRLVDAGKVGCAGVSNETPWGMARCAELRRADPGRYAAVAVAEQPGSLVCRGWQEGGGAAEAAVEEGIGLLLYGPLAGGLLGSADKYRAVRSRGGGDGGGAALRWEASSPDARLARLRGRYGEGEARYAPRPALVAARRAYVRVASARGMALGELALRHALSSPAVAGAVTGASTPAQLRELAAWAGRGGLDDDALEACDEVHQRWPSPAP